MHYIIRAIIGYVIVGLILVISAWGIILLVKKDNHLLKKVLSDNTPFTSERFEFLFHNPIIKTSKYGNGFQHCSFKRSHENTTSIDVDDTILFLFGTLKVVRSLPATWVELYDDPENNGACYFLFANNAKSSLICLKYSTIISYISELSRICKVYSQPIDWDGQNY